VKNSCEIVQSNSRSHVPRFPPGSILYKFAQLFPAIESIEKPAVDSHLESLPWYDRVAETMRYILLKLEYGLSPKGHLRWWMKINLLLFLLMSLPALLFIPLLLIVAGAFVSIASMTLTILMTLLKIMGVIAVLTAMLGIFLRLLGR